ncbi:hypothetical protein ACFOGJ_24795 [Marinibaculum pumilum]|uniref:SGNH hydrolase-type esterase domain-containing protein n=1 Tax=Marinibaculum pumilum TaxID=1766165 RepID=A0ABV7L836_9PROT
MKLALSILVGLVVGFLAVEAMYRVYLSVEPPAGTALAEGPRFGVLDASRWEYDSELGYVYPPDRAIHVTNLKDGRVSDCTLQREINSRGNIGPITGDYQSAAFKILLFGDSFPAFIVDGVTFPALLQRRLTAALGKPAHVVNFGRDGTGILQMMDLAAATVPEWQPDLVLFTFISDDLDRARIWRTVAEKSGFRRILVTDRPDPDPPLSRAQDITLVEPRATADWCRTALEAGGEDPLAAELERRFDQIAEQAARREFDLLSIDHSFVIALLLHQDPFRQILTPQPWTVPRYDATAYDQDPRFARDFAALKASGIPFAFIHLPIAPELPAGYQISPRQAALWSDLRTLAPDRVIELKPVIGNLPDPLRMSITPTNHHPSRFGMEVYARAIETALADAGLLPDAAASPPGLSQ